MSAVWRWGRLGWCLSGLCLLGLVLAGGWRLADSALWRANWDELVWAGGQHVRLVFSGLGLALVVGVPLGVVLSRPLMKSVAGYVLQGVNVVSAIPVLAVLALAMMLVGIGDRPAIVALFFASLLPIVRNSWQGLRGVPAPLIEAACGMGMSGWQCLWQVELPCAFPVMLAGVRTAAAICVATAPLAFLIGASGYGELIFPGIYLNDTGLLTLGAGATAFTALLLDRLLAGLGRLMMGRMGYWG